MRRRKAHLSTWYTYRATSTVLRRYLRTMDLRLSGNDQILPDVPSTNGARVENGMKIGTNTVLPSRPR